MGKLSQLRKGASPHKILSLFNGKDETKVAVVILPSDVIRTCEEQTEEYVNENKSKANDNIRNQYFDTLLVYNCLRDPDNLEEKLADSVKEVGEVLDIEDITRITGAYRELMLNKAPKIELMSEEDLTEIKNFLSETPLKDLNTVSLVHLTNFHQTMVS
jgi:tRNA(Ser,Leu) C12 N-acetylase TAN1